MSFRKLLEATADLSNRVTKLKLKNTVPYVYNPLEYAWETHAAYIRRFGKGRKRVFFLGMNPGPWGMAQTGVPFGEINSVRDWMGISGKVGTPAREQPQRPVMGFACTRSEVSGRRLWGLMQQRFGTAEVFFKDHFVANYCPLIFMEESGRNRTPDKLPSEVRGALFQACDEHLLRVIEELKPQWLLGVGKFAEKRLQAVQANLSPGLQRITRIDTIIHPSPANPHANRGWAEAVTTKLLTLGVWNQDA